ncbi:amino acid ABC transporter substrate-binding protein [Nocardia jejuensis]|uniref:amino acid ABC transporter substrate-binding protein n=1 Tax=Nocardia jejuensis TaxID=328049 RepID=UPI00082B7E70|nr:amino acid ABC transporter substrate-binding protein [Nocardia jejuensis]
MRRKLFAAVLAVVAATAALTACSSNDDPNVLKVGTEGTYSPFSYQENGALTGYDIEVVEAIGEKLGRKVEFVQTPWDAIFAGLESKRFDLVANQVTISPERAQKYSLSQPYTVSDGVIVAKSDNNGIHALADLNGKTCAQSTTSNWSKVASGAGCKVEGVEGFVQAIQLLKNGRVDATVNDTLAVAEYNKKTGDNSVKVVGKTGETSRQGFAARKDSQQLIDQIDTALDQLRSDGTLAKISEKYFGTDVSK